MGSTLLVTGASGFAGGHLLDRLRWAERVVGWHRPGGAPPETHTGVQWRAVDVGDGRAVSRAIAEDAPARIFHLAGEPHVGASWRQGAAPLHTNVLGTHHILDAVAAAGRPCRVLVVSSAQIYRPSDDPIREDAALGPTNPYGFSKLAQDQLALRAAIDDGLDVVVVRPFNHIGPGQRAEYAIASFARQIASIEAGLAPAVLRVGNLEARRDLTDVRDVTDAYVRLMERGQSGRPYNVCSGRAWGIGDVLHELLHLSSTPVSVEVDPSQLRPNDMPILQGDATRIRSEVGWTPRIAVEETLRDTLAWWRTRVVSPNFR